jgi:hypothetical protein
MNCLERMGGTMESIPNAYRDRVEHYQHQLEGWEKDHEELKAGLWKVEDWIGTYGGFYRSIERLERDLWADVDRDPRSNNFDPVAVVNPLLETWLEGATRLVRLAEPLVQQYGSVEGLDALRERCKQVEIELSRSEDGPFTMSDELIALQDQAIADFHAGRTEPMTHVKHRHE